MFRQTTKTATTRVPLFDPFADISARQLASMRSSLPSIDLVKVSDLAALARAAADRLEELCQYFQLGDCGIPATALRHAEEAERTVRGFRIMSQNPQLRTYQPRPSDPTEDYLVSRMAWSTHHVLRETERIIQDAISARSLSLDWLKWGTTLLSAVEEMDSQVSPLIRVPVAV